MSGRMSGVQREVTHLYRRVLRAARVKDAESGSTTTTELVKSEFRHEVGADWTDRRYHVGSIAVALFFCPSSSCCKR